MEYRVEALSDAAGVRVDTIRFYQGKGLIPMPRRRGRIAIYADEHLKGIRRIRALLDDGFSLAQIRRLLAGEAADGSRSKEKAEGRLLRALVEESVGERTLTRAELASEAGVPEALIAAVERVGLVEAVRVEGEERFSEADLEMARVAIGILGTGFPLDELLNLAVRHAQHVREVADAGIDLFDEFVRKREGAAADGEAITHAFRTLLPQVTRLVALHFQRTLVNRALERLRGSGDGEALERAVAATESARLVVSWR